MRLVLKILAPALALAGLAFAAPGAQYFSVHEVDARGMYTRTTPKVAAGSDAQSVHYYQPAPLALTFETLSLLPEQSKTLDDLVIVGVSGDAGFTPTLVGAFMVKDQDGQALVKLVLDIATSAAVGRYDISILVRNTATGQNFELPLSVRVR